MANWKKLAQGAAGAAGAGGGLNVEDVFSTYLYRGSSSSKTINNGIDLSTEGGLVWLKKRTDTGHHQLLDTERGNNAVRSSSQSGGDDTSISYWNFSFNTNGFGFNTTDSNINSNQEDYCSWTFRKAPKFFDVVEYTGTGANRTISHNLGSTPGMIIVKRTDSTSDWACYHRGLNGGTSPATKFIRLNLTNAESGNAGYWNNTEPTDSVFTVGTNAATNASGATYVAYLFAHNDGDGDFGPTGDQDIIKCGSYTGAGTTDVDVELGFEPQWILIKNTSSSFNWAIFDTMRGITGDGSSAYLYPNWSDAELTDTGLIKVNPTGFTITGSQSFINNNTDTFTYIAIRRGPMGIPESATDVFAVNEATNPRGFVTTGFPVDLHMQRKTEAGDGFNLADRLRGENKFLYTTETSSEYTFSSSFPAEFDHMNGIDNYSYSSQTKDTIFYNWRRAPNYFDVVAYTGDGVAGRTVSHNLGVAPEMMWVKSRSNAYDWIVYHKDLGNATYSAEESWLKLNASNSQDFDTTAYWNGTAPTSSVFSLNNNTVNQSGSNFIAYLFASLTGISKVGSYTGNGTNQNIDCGFSNGARFVLVKAFSTTSNWQLAGDFGNGIVAGSDSLLRLDLTNAITNFDFIDPYSGGFNVTGLQLNTSGTEYIFYAIA